LKFQQLTSVQETDSLFLFAIIEFKELLIWGVDSLCFNALQFGRYPPTFYRNFALSDHQNFQETFSMLSVLFG
jgi:hypothetical protein